MLKKLVFPILLMVLTSISFAGPTVVPHPKSPTVKVRDDKFVVVREFKDPKTIKLIQDIFLRANKVGNTRTHLKTTTHMIDFSYRWLINLKNGEVGRLSVTSSNVYKVTPKDLQILQNILNPKL